MNRAQRSKCFLGPQPIKRLTAAPYLLGAIDDEVASGVQRALIELAQVTVRQAAQQAVGGAKHDGNLADEGLLVLRLDLLLALLNDGLGDVHVEGCRVPAGGKDATVQDFNIVVIVNKTSQMRFSQY